MNFILQTILIAAVGYAVQNYLPVPWWSMVIVAGIMGLLFRHKRSATAFFAGFLGVGLLWGLLGQSANNLNNELFSSKMNAVYGDSAEMLLVLVPALLGGVLAGLAAMTGNLFRKLFNKKEEKVVNKEEVVIA